MGKKKNTKSSTGADPRHAAVSEPCLQYAPPLSLGSRAKEGFIIAARSSKWFPVSFIKHCWLKSSFAAFSHCLRSWLDYYGAYDEIFPLDKIKLGDTSGGDILYCKVSAPSLPDLRVWWYSIYMIFTMFPSMFHTSPQCAPEWGCEGSLSGLFLPAPHPADRKDRETAWGDGSPSAVALGMSHTLGEWCRCGDKGGKRHRHRGIKMQGLYGAVEIVDQDVSKGGLERKD